ncbi:Site-specific tyrosine recombinase XerD, partial [hydrothermal vent metagenome]
MKENMYSKGFKAFLRLERALSENTVAAYLHDVNLLFSFLQSKTHNLSIKDVTPDDLKDFLQYINEMGLGAFSQSRVVSGIKSFFSYLILENIVNADPSALLESPKLGKKLPDVLSEEEMFTLIQSVDLSDPLGERNKAIMETLYACGLRVSELTNLKLSDLHFNQEIILVTGKGNKQRIVPVGENARKQLQTYIQQVRVRIAARKGAEDIVFLNQHGGKISRQMIFLIIKKHVEKA